MSFKNLTLVLVLIVFTSSFAFAAGPIEDYSADNFTWSGEPGDSGSRPIATNVDPTEEDASLYLYASSYRQLISSDGYYYVQLGTGDSPYRVRIDDIEFEEFGTSYGTLTDFGFWARGTWDESVITWGSSISSVVSRWGFTARFTHLPINLD